MCLQDNRLGVYVRVIPRAGKRRLMRQPDLIPEHERANLEMTVEEAMELAQAGEADAGRDLLQGGLYRAEQFRDSGVEWGETLVRCYRAAMTRFADELHEEVHEE